MATVFWGMESTMTVEWLPYRAVADGVTYCGILTCLCPKVQQWCKDKYAQRELLLHEMPDTIPAIKQHIHTYIHT
jgi:hypothetical protein